MNSNDLDRMTRVFDRLKRGKTGKRLDSGRCSECGASGFVYNNGMEFSVDGVRGYRCVTCGAIKPERK